MLRIQMIGLALVAVLVMSAAAAGSAMAEHQWLINGAPIASAIKVHSLALVLLEDEKATGGATQVHCHAYDAGTVGPGALDLIESVTTELLKGSDKLPCNFVKKGACNASPAPLALAIHLPWHTSIVLIENEVRDLILSDGNGAPGWSVTCSTILGSVTDTCEEEPGKMGTTALSEVTEGVLATFDKVTPRAKCSIGGEKAGVVTGTDLTYSPSSTQHLLFD